MRFLQIWLGGNIPEHNQSCIDSVKAHLRHSDDYNFITDDSIGTYKAQIEALFPWVANYWDTMWVNCVSEMTRLFFLTKYPGTLYVDCDVNLIYIPEMARKATNPKPLCGHFQGAKCECVLYNGNHTNIFSQLLNVSFNFTYLNHELRTQLLSTPNNVSRGLNTLLPKDVFDAYPYEYYEHYHLMGFLNE